MSIYIYMYTLYRGSSARKVVVNNTATTNPIMYFNYYSILEIFNLIVFIFSSKIELITEQIIMVVQFVYPYRGIFWYVWVIWNWLPIIIVQQY